jgi:hypothetical protein
MPDAHDSAIKLPLLAANSGIILRMLLDKFMEDDKRYADTEDALAYAAGGLITETRREHWDEALIAIVLHDGLRNGLLNAYRQRKAIGEKMDALFAEIEMLKGLR